MTPLQRQDWIYQWLKERQAQRFTADVLNSDFVNAYIDATGVKYKTPLFGAPHCPTLGRDLSAMYKEGRLKRYATGIDGGLCYQGFPRWVYVYSLW